jgi:hypothetical protein
MLIVFAGTKYFPLLGPIYSDVAKRVYSPDLTKKAILIRRISGWDLNFILKIKEDFKTKTLFWTSDFEPDQKVDLNERIVWSDDSSFIVLTVDRPVEEWSRRAIDDPNQYGKVYYAYDFKDGKKYKPDDKNTIISIMNSRCKEPKLDEKKW